MQRPTHRGFLGLPETRPGKAAVACLVLLFVAAGLRMFLVEVAGLEEEGGLAEEIALRVSGTTGALSGIAAALLSAFAVVFRHERSIYIWPALVIGGLVLILEVGEIVVPD